MAKCKKNKLLFRQFETSQNDLFTNRASALDSLVLA